MKKQTKEEIAGGVFVGVSIAIMFLLLLFLWSPVGFYLSRWSDYWDDPDLKQSNIDWEFQNDAYYQNRKKANRDCEEKAVSYFGVNQISSYASSTSENYETYDCYGIKWTKIK